MRKNNPPVRDASMCVSLIDIIAANVNNKRLSDEAFRQFVRNSLAVIEFISNIRKA